jgi:putative sigma-54 modulation protein
MNISITFRQMETSDAIKKYVMTKVSRLQKLLQQPMTAKVTLTIQKQLHVAEVQLSSGKRRSEAREASEEMYASIDKVVDKLERQISTNKGEQVSKKRRSKVTVRQGTTGLDVAVTKVRAPTTRKKTATKKAKTSRQAAK